MLQESYSPNKGYNELVFDLSVYFSNLPHSIEAFFFGKGNRCCDPVDFARSIHSGFIDHFGISSEALPLLLFNDDGDGDVLFKLLPDATSE